ncbi:MAG: class I adenylate-forming enzyme family protein [Acutalibacteraceae bacterium]|nr:class I adenylate-forming enzyme family protein [Oscillospiraceae bacterium]
MFCSIIEAIKYHAVKRPEKICLRDAVGEISYGDYYELIEKDADFFVEKGLKKGDYVVLKAEQSVNYLSAFHAIQLAGGIPVPLEKNVKTERICEVMSQVNAKMCVGAQIGEMSFSYEDISESEKCGCSFALPNGGDTGEVLFTTGTTGKSKGVVMTHKADIAVAENVIYGVEMKKDNIEIIPMPLNHSFALRRYYANMVNGSSAILLDGVIFIDRFFECFDKYGATAAALAPAALSIILKLSRDRLKEYRDKIDYIQIGSAQLPENDREKLISLLPRSRLYNFYGSSEAGCSCVLNFNSEDDLPNCIGRPTVNSEIFFVDENCVRKASGKDSPERLVTGGKMLMKEYFGDSELTRKTLVGGAVFSNDIGYSDDEGRVFMLGRNDDIIISGGNKISPVEVETLAAESGMVEECALIGRKDPVAGEIPVLYAVINQRYNEEEFLMFLSERLESFMVPKAVRKINKLPKTFNGKILRKELKKAEGGIQ